MQPTTHRLLELQRLLADFGNVERQVHRRRGQAMVPENDAEHSYNLAMTAWYLSGWFPDLDQTLLLKYALAHDMVEVHAGDTYAYGTVNDLTTKQSREADASGQLAEEWGDFPDMLDAIQAYEQLADNESRFIYALDKIMPIMLNILSDGYSWKQQSISLQDIHVAKFEKVKLSPEILAYYEQLRKLLLKRPDLIN